MTEPLHVIGIDPTSAAGLILLGLCGGILGGFIGGGGAFVMTPGLMSLGAEGLLSVGSNLLHRLGRMSTSARRRAPLRNVDFRMLVVLGIPSLLGVEAGRMITSYLRRHRGAGVADLYLDIILIVVLSLVARMLVVDLLHGRRPAAAPGGLSAKGVAQRIRPLRVPPVMRFPASNVVVSLWLVLLIGFAGGWLAGSIALGGFLTVPAMIYLLGAPASTAIATDMALVLVVCAYGTVSYAARGYVDLRVTLLLYAGSILGFHLGLLGTRLVREELIRIATCLVLALVALNRVLALPLACADAGWLAMGSATRLALHLAGLAALYGGGVLVAAMVTGAVIRALIGGVAPLGGVDVLTGEED